MRIFKNVRGDCPNRYREACRCFLQISASRRIKQCFKIHILIFLTVVLPNSSAKESDVPDGEVNYNKSSPMLEGFKKSYCHIISGNKNDKETNSKKEKFYRNKIHKLKMRSKKPDGIKMKKYKELAKLYSLLAHLNSTILYSLNRGSMLLPETSMRQMIGVEEKLSAILGKPISRDWLTFDETAKYHERGYKWKTESPDILPFAKTNWEIPKTKKKRKDGKADGRKSPVHPK